MPKMVSELTQGRATGRSGQAGALADTATRVWRVILNEPDESYLLADIVGVQIGDPFSDQAPDLPCVSLEERADGESRLVRIITAQYQTTPGEGGGGQDPGTFMPDVRPAKFSTSTNLYEVPADQWRKLTSSGQSDGPWTPIRNPCGDPVEGVLKLEPITQIRVTQFELTPASIHEPYYGRINSETMSLSGYMTLAPHTVMFRGATAEPTVEAFGSLVIRGFNNVYEFAYRPHWGVGFGNAGWDFLYLLEGYNCNSFNPAAPAATQEPEALPLKFEGPDSATPGKLVQPLTLADGARPKNRAMVMIATNGQYIGQNPSAMPVALNADGTPRKIVDNAGNIVNNPIIRRYQIYEDANLTQALNLRLF